jgi:hypothetical protein
MMVLNVDLPLADDPVARFQAVADEELGVGTVRVRRMQLLGPGPVGYRYMAFVEELPGPSTTPAPGR